MKKALIITSSILVGLSVLSLAIWMTISFLFNTSKPYISIVLPQKTVYYVGEKEDFDDLEVYIYDKDKKIEITDYEITGFDSSAPSEKLPIVVSTEYKKQDYSYTFYVIIEKIPSIHVITDIEMKALPKTTYHLNERLDVSGGIIQINYSDGIYELMNLQKNYISNFDSSTLGDKELIVQCRLYGNVYQTSYTITVVK